MHGTETTHGLENQPGTSPGENPASLEDELKLCQETCPVTLVSLSCFSRPFHTRHRCLPPFLKCSVTFSWKGPSPCNLHQPSCESLCLLSPLIFLTLHSPSLFTAPWHYSYPTGTWFCCLLAQSPIYQLTHSLIQLHIGSSFISPFTHSSIRPHALSPSLLLTCCSVTSLTFTELHACLQRAPQPQLSQTVCHCTPPCPPHYHGTFHS